MDPLLEIQIPVLQDNAGKTKSNNCINFLNDKTLGEETNAVMFGREKMLIFVRPIVNQISSGPHLVIPQYIRLQKSPTLKINRSQLSQTLIS